MNFETFLLPTHWAGALLYADESGLDDDECAEINEWLANRPELGLCVGCGDTSEFNWRFACDCSNFTFEVLGAAA